MKYLNLLFGISLIAAGAIGGACVTEEASDDGGEGGSGAGGPNPTTNILDDSEHLSQEEIERRTYHLAGDELQGRAPGSEGGLAARQFIIDELSACGVQSLDAAGFEQPIGLLPGAANILGYIPGTDDTLKERYVMVSAHYDHLGAQVGTVYNGADDNAVGVAVSIAIGCAIAASPQPRSVIIANWDSEEPPNFLQDQMGSQYYADNPVVPLEQTDAVIVMDLVGGDLWPGFNNHQILGAELSPQVQAAVDASPVPEGLQFYQLGLHTVEEWPAAFGHQPWSDYDAFRMAGKPVLFLANAQTVHYHEPTDTPDTLNYWKVALEAKLLLRIVSRLANATETPVFEPVNAFEGSTRDGRAFTGGGNFTRDAAMLATVLEMAVAPGGMVESLGLGATSRTKLEGDLAETQAIHARMEAGEALVHGSPEVRRLRDAAQRLMCLGHSKAPGAQFKEADCNLLGSL
jgi:hypothetical protein